MHNMKPTFYAMPLLRWLFVTALFTSPALLVLTGFVVADTMPVTHALYAYSIIVIASGALLYPFVSNLSALTKYAQDLARDKRVKAPAVPFVDMIGPIGSAMHVLQRSWEARKKQQETIIMEREILVDSLPDILIMTNDHAKIIRTNRAARAIFGQNLAQKNVSDVVQSPTFIDAVTAVNRDYKGREIEFRVEDPVLRDFLCIIERFPVPSGGGITTVITMNDITELKAVEQMRADFVANASHEIRTPLASIKGFIETLMGPAKDDPDAHAQFLPIMLEQADRMQQLIADLLSLSKIEMNAHSVPTDKVDLAAIIRKEAEISKHAADAKSMPIMLDIHDNLPAVKGEANELTQVVHNLVSNAIKYGHAETDVTIMATITAELPQDLAMRNLTRVVQLTVSDHGEGIAKQHLPRLMERFYRVDTARTRTIGGTGLGLAIVKGIVNRHRGVITVESEVGKGTSFHVFLPLYDA
jgi:two-component system phosphate regulon sensor histidine kinase PhoR